MANIQKISQSKNVDYVPASLIYEFDGFRNKMGKIYEGGNLHW